MKDLQILIISPIRNEERTLQILINSVFAQTLQPKKWLIIDDNSTDLSFKIAEKNQGEILEVLSYPKNNIKRKTGGNVVDIINYGLNYAKERNIEWDVLLKLDGDIELINNNYFERIIEEFKTSPLIGILSGIVFNIEDSGKKNIETKYYWHTQGQTKFYLRKCLESMNGLKPMLGWDGVDDILARHNGYITKVIKDIEARHFYKTRTRVEEGGVYNGLRREALGYRNRSYQFYMYLAKSIAMLFKKPIVIGSVYFLYYSLFYNLKYPNVLNREEIKAVRAFNKKRLFGKILMESTY